MVEFSVESCTVKYSHGRVMWNKVELIRVMVELCRIY